MKRPGSLKGRPVPTGFTVEFASQLVEYFQTNKAQAEHVKAGRTPGPARFPTVTGFCDSVRVNRHTARGWSRTHPAMREALQRCAEIRLQIARLELERLVFDTEFGAPLLAKDSIELDLRACAQSPVLTAFDSTAPENQSCAQSLAG